MAKQKQNDPIVCEHPEVWFIKNWIMNSECRGPQTILYGTHCLSVDDCQSPYQNIACSDTRKLATVETLKKVEQQGFPYRPKMGPVDYDRIAETIEEVRRVAQEMGGPVLTAEQSGCTDDDEGGV